MEFKKFIFYLLIFNFFFLIIVIFLFLFNPKLFYFRSWEYFDDFVYPGIAKKQHLFYETGDLSRGYIFQKYGELNIITINDLGNRIACYDKTKKKSFLLLGDSAMFGSNISDENTLPKLLCKKYPEFSFYNGSRTLELDLLRLSEFKFDSLIITAPEFAGFNRYCAVLDSFKSRKKINLDIEQLKIKKDTNNLDIYSKLIKRPIKYLSFKLNVIFDTSKTIYPPSEHLFLNRNLQRNEINELNCIKKLNNYFKDLQIKTLFFYFPEKRTVLDKNYINKNFKKTYITSIGKKLSNLGINYFDASKCLKKENLGNLQFYYFHDTHMTSEGMQYLSKCLINKKNKFFS